MSREAEENLAAYVALGMAKGYGGPLTLAVAVDPSGKIMERAPATWTLVSCRVCCPPEPHLPCVSAVTVFGHRAGTAIEYSVATPLSQGFHWLVVVEKHGTSGTNPDEDICAIRSQGHEQPTGDRAGI